MTHPSPQDETTPASGSDDTGAPAKQHGDPLLASAQGRGDGEEGTRHGHDATGPLPDEAD